MQVYAINANTVYVLMCRLAHEQSWRNKYNIFISSGVEYTGDYSEHLARSTFCHPR